MSDDERESVAFIHKHLRVLAIYGAVHEARWLQSKNNDHSCDDIVQFCKVPGSVGKI